MTFPAGAGPFSTQTISLPVPNEAILVTAMVAGPVGLFDGGGDSDTAQVNILGEELN